MRVRVGAAVVAAATRREAAAARLPLGNPWPAGSLEAFLYQIKPAMLVMPSPALAYLPLLVAGKLAQKGFTNRRLASGWP